MGLAGSYANFNQQHHMSTQLHNPAVFKQGSNSGAPNPPVSGTAASYSNQQQILLTAS